MERRAWSLSWRAIAIATGIASIALSGCGHAGRAVSQVSTVERGPGTPQQPAPLTGQDVQSYLKVMQAAADRLKNPTADDRATFARMKKFTSVGDSGEMATPADVAAMQRATVMAMSMDEIVAQEMGMDSEKYRAIRTAIESTINNPKISADFDDDDDDAPPPSHHAPVPKSRRIHQADNINEKSLAPYKTEIQDLLMVVRNPQNITAPR